jgi:hypothetical protein
MRIPKQSKKKDIKYLDKLWREASLLRYGARCEYCGRTDKLNVHHIFSRAKKSVRWDTDNACILCPLHHCLSSDFSAHLTGMLFYDFIVNLRGQDWYKRLRLRADSIVKPDFKLIELDLGSQKVAKYKKSLSGGDFGGNTHE